MHILMVYGTKEGQTATIIERMAQIVRNQGHQVTACSVKEIPAAFATDTFDAAMVGGSIHMGAYPPQLRTFVTRHRDWLNTAPSGFFTVCMAIQSKNAAERDAAKAYGSRFVEVAQWHPQLIETFAGAVKYTQYNFITRYIMKRITKREGGSTDTARDHEYTDWDAVARFTRQFLETITQMEEARTK
ncbi:MAG: protoporphyrinogen oxidase [Gammaproteobacteria bacterium]|nr:protoporphyrinogen oxidase [Gammaproteobacteria bacterium]